MRPYPESRVHPIVSAPGALLFKLRPLHLHHGDYKAAGRAGGEARGNFPRRIYFYRAKSRKVVRAPPRAAPLNPLRRLFDVFLTRKLNTLMCRVVASLLRDESWNRSEH
ncbi:hypothetical protein EVAR_10634_1 [Eumeta japonica]|uniref:Uncharacterized protein n=1 Tax=Eumeta variegata TaxID=151549 RepID=A0A4C1U6X4_EUMVA|nr:hypothetical protein EVAR_10634_1 [Eumeta japonica]